MHLLSNNNGIGTLPTAGDGLAPSEGVQKVRKEVPNQESYCKLSSNHIMAPMLQLYDIKNIRLQHIYNDEKNDLVESFAEIKKTMDPKKLKLEMILSFWLALYL